MVLRGHTGAVLFICYNPHQNDELASAGADDRTIRIWDLSLLRRMHEYFATGLGMYQDTGGKKKIPLWREFRLLQAILKQRKNSNEINE